MFILACFSQPHKISKAANYGDIDRSIREITISNIINVLDEKLKNILKDISGNQHTTVFDIAKRLSISESYASRQINELVDLKAPGFIQRRKLKTFLYVNRKNASLDIEIYDFRLYQGFYRNFWIN